MSTNQPVYKIGGISVYFPCKPYPSQFSMMDKIIKGIERRQNCLLESPTGSGKSLALLCSALGWQAEQLVKRDLEEEEEESHNQTENCCCQCHLELPPVNQTVDKATPSPTCNQAFSTTEIHKLDDCKDEDDFQNNNTSFRTPNVNKDLKKQRKHVSISYEDDYSQCKTGEDNSTCCKDLQSDQYNTDQIKMKFSNCDCCWKNKTSKAKVPKIYFGTRTHKQVAQIVRELKKTAYHDVRMTILGSREVTCIHPAVSRSSNKNEGCAELIKGPGCRFKERTKRIESQRSIKNLGLESAWDIEDLVGLCKSSKACPYFLSRGLKGQSELIICPYNYLIDPLIRESMEINLKDEIIILDEAHNIEDSSREAASQTVNLDTLEKAVHEIDGLINLNVKVSEYLQLKQMTGSLIQFINQQSLNLEQKDFEQACKIWSGFDIVAQMESIGFGPKHFPDLMAAFMKVNEELDDITKQKLGHDGKLSNAVLTCFEQIFLVFKNMYKEEMKYLEDYRAALLKSNSYTNLPTNGNWLNPKQRRGNRVHVVSYTLNFWCMSPAVAFSDFDNCRCVVLTSGTLSPMSSFQSELGLPFPIQLEANHVIKDNQVWIGTIGQGPTGTSLQAVYKNLETFTFQDELGQLVLKVCQTVPNGVLCFLPSYKVLEKLSQRWKTTGIWRKIRSVKVIICEPRGRDKDDFEELMKSFYHAADSGANDLNSDNDDGDECINTTGALFFAVCRGKVSEGLDFADNFARAVISVGIPYPNFKDLQVELKRKYNDQHRLKKGLLSGSDWYEIQAFRALNQALGRCIRHRRDWGSLILVDDRFVKNGQKYCKGLSKWVRNKVKTFHDFKSSMSSLTNFVEYRVENHETEVGADSSFISSTPTTPGEQKSNETLLGPKTSAVKDSRLVTSLYSSNRNNPVFVESLIQDNSHLASIFKVCNGDVKKQNLLKTPKTPKMAPNATVTSKDITPIATVTSKDITPIATVTSLYSSNRNNPVFVESPIQDNSHLASIFKVCNADVKKQNLSKTPKTPKMAPNATVTSKDITPITIVTSKAITPNTATTLKPSSELKIFQVTPSGMKTVEAKPVSNSEYLTPAKSNIEKTDKPILHVNIGEKIEKISNYGNTLKLHSKQISSWSAQQTTCSSEPEIKPGTHRNTVLSSSPTKTVLSSSPTKTVLSSSSTKTVLSSSPTKTVLSSSHIKTLLSSSPTKTVLSSSHSMNHANVMETVTRKDQSSKNFRSSAIKDPVEITNEPEGNKFFKFCKIPNIKKRVPSLTEENTKIVDVSKSNIQTEMSVTPLKNNLNNIGNTPPLFDSDLDLDDFKSQTTEEKKIIRKRLFKEASHNTSVLPNKDDDIQTESIENKNFDTSKVEHNTRISSCRLSLSNPNLSNLNTEKKSDENGTQNILNNEKVLIKRDNKDDAETNTTPQDGSLGVRRGCRVKRRRRSGGNVRFASNKKSRGVEFLEEIDDAPVEPHDTPVEPVKKTSSVICSGCGIVLVENPADLEKRMRVPPFLPTEDNKIHDVVFLPRIHASEYLKPLAAQLDTGQQLNSLWCMEEKVCVIFLTCSNCCPSGTTQVSFGCQVVFTDQQSKYNTGQTWLLSNKVKIT